MFFFWFLICSDQTLALAPLLQKREEQLSNSCQGCRMSGGQGKCPKKTLLTRWWWCSSDYVILMPSRTDPLHVITMCFFSCPEQLNRWPCHWLTHSLTVLLLLTLTLETCDLWDIWSEWWGNMTWPTFLQFFKHFWIFSKILIFF